MPLTRKKRECRNPFLPRKRKSQEQRDPGWNPSKPSPWDHSRTGSRPIPRNRWNASSPNLLYEVREVMAVIRRRRQSDQTDTGGSPYGRHIRGDYVYASFFGFRITAADRIFPLVIPEYDPVITTALLLILGLDASFTLVSGPENVEVAVNYLERIGPDNLLFSLPLQYLHFSPYPPPR